MEYNCDASVNAPAKPDRPTDSRTHRSPHLFGVAIDYTDGAMETKGAETGDVAHKDIAAAQWCANATQLAGQKWEYLKVPQKGFETLQPSRLEHLVALKPMPLL